MGLALKCFRTYCREARARELSNPVGWVATGEAPRTVLPTLVGEEVGAMLACLSELLQLIVGFVGMALSALLSALTVALRTTLQALITEISREVPTFAARLA